MSAAATGTGRTTLHHLGGADGLPDLLLIHGFGSDRFAWSATAPEFFATHRVWAVELPGHTAPPVDAGRGDAAAMADAVLSVIGPLQAPFALAGHSLGGAVALEIAARRPELVSALALIAPAGLGAPVDAGFLAAFPALDTPEEAQALLVQLVARAKLISPQMVQHVLGFLGAPGRREALARIAGHLRTVSPPPAGPGAVVVWGELDAISAPLPGLRETFGERLHILAGAGHMPHVEQARATNRILSQAFRPA